MEAQRLYLLALFARARPQWKASLTQIVVWAHYLSSLRSTAPRYTENYEENFPEEMMQRRWAEPLEHVTGLTSGRERGQAGRKEGKVPDWSPLPRFVARLGGDPEPKYPGEKPHRSQIGVSLSTIFGFSHCLR